MALTNLLKSPQFLCKQVKIYPPTAVLCLGHSQLAVQASNVSLSSELIVACLSLPSINNIVCASSSVSI